MRARLVALTDAFLPPAMTDPDALRRNRAAILQSWLGVATTAVLGSLYAVLGSPWSGAAILVIMVGLLLTPSAIARGVSCVWIGNVLIAVTWLATFVVVSRSGGFASPALVWCFLLPLCTSAVCGQRSAVTWAGLAALQVAAFYVLDLRGMVFAQDFPPGLLAVLRLSGYAGVIGAVIGFVILAEGARLASHDALARANRLLERERLLGDMHDGVGTQLLGLLIQARAGALEPARLVRELETCLDDLRLIVDSLTPEERSIHVALGEMRARVEPRFAAAGIELEWEVALAADDTWPPETILQLLRASQEILANALRHAGASRVTFWLGALPDGGNVLRIEDNGTGFDHQASPRHGRGLTSLQVRARRLGGTLRFAPSNPGTRVELLFET